MNPEKRMTGFLIHGFAVAHATAAGLLAQTIVGDEAVLTALTVAMIISIARLNGAKWNQGEALAFLGVFAGTIIGTRGAALLYKWIPGIGNIANAVVSAETTEMLGWMTYLFVSKGYEDPSQLSDSQINSLKKEANSLRKEEEKENRRLFDSMSQEDKVKYEKIISDLKRRDMDEDSRLKCINELEEIARKYS